MCVTWKTWKRVKHAGAAYLMILCHWYWASSCQNHWSPFWFSLASSVCMWFQIQHTMAWRSNPIHCLPGEYGLVTTQPHPFLSRWPVIVAIAAVLGSWVRLTTKSIQHFTEDVADFWRLLLSSIIALVSPLPMAFLLQHNSRHLEASLGYNDYFLVSFCPEISFAIGSRGN